MTTRISGLASGMDIDSMVKDLMKAQRIPLDKLTQKKQLLEWQRDDYRDMNKLLKDFDQLIFDGVGRQSTFLKKTVTSTNDSVVTATSNGSSGNISTTIEKITLATSRTWIGQPVLTGSNPMQADTKLSSLGTLPSDNKLKFKLTKPGTSDFVKDGTTDKIFEITIDPTTETIDSLTQKLSNSDLGVSAFYDSRTGQIVITNKETGAGSKITFADTNTQNLYENLGFTSNVNNELTSTNNNLGTDATFTLNGLSMSRSSNSFTISGVTYTLKSNTTSPVTISASTDSQGIFDSIIKFVDQYNTTIGKINDKVSEERYRKYDPLTDEQRKDLSDKEAELWDAKAKSGMLRGDTILSSGLNQLRSDMYASVNTGKADYDQLAKIGIQTSSSYLDKGKLTITDENKLKDAIAKDPEAVKKLFTNSGTTSETKGIAYRLRDSIDSIMGKVEAKAGNSSRGNNQFAIGKQLIDMDTRITNFNTRLTQVEDRYYRQFTAMEQAISRSNQQSVYLSQQFGGEQ
ncbi:flagellar hook-associated protein 2 [Fictibacillus sp. KIGAM418]|uniref:Flagellar hook-associated protein 2 n=1 Tax=Fictibacillus marinisediminis TaxID=2878389 RepID=A0A9X2BII4_9BACL|nr:flagellar hook-associated protein 2 [Fictibacillus marinisediminis]MCK6258673.1 flagellar hook-associated protein 2 [Fictibacillus marinisediminis]